MRKASIVVGMQFGDEGKGQAVDWLCKKYNAKLVVRFGGGHQCGHNVVRNGYRHNFSSIGSGTLCGADTHIAAGCMVEWNAMKRELWSLRRNGFWPFVTVDPGCLVATPYHSVMNRIRNSINNHGTCGVGIGETRSYWLKHGQDAIFAGDDRHVVRNKLRLMRYRMHEEIRSLEGVDEDQYSAFSNISDDAIVSEHISPVAAIRKTEDMVSDYNNHIVFEGHQGFLLDESFGFHPHTTWSDCTANSAIDICKSFGIDYKVFGCLRAVMSRHGNGPFPSWDESIKLSDPGNKWNAGQGEMRFGWFDSVLLRYAKKHCPVDYTVVSWVDEAKKLDNLSLVDSYKFNLATLDNIDSPLTFAHQEKLTEAVSSAIPVLTKCTIDDILERVELVAPIAAIGTSADKRIDTGVL